MRSKKLLFLLVLVLTAGLIATGCGDDDSTSSTSAETTATESTTASEDTDATTEETTTEDTDSDASSSDIDSEGVYNACVDAISGTPAEAAGESTCAQARDAFEQCAKQADSLDGSAQQSAIKICQDAADQAIKSLEAAG